MEPIIKAPHLVLARHIAIELRNGDQTQPVPAELRYDASDPFAVTLLIGDPACPVVWAFARELLQEGLREPCGDGDVHAWPFPDDDGREILLIELVSNDGEALLEANPDEVRRFLALTHQFVAPGEESSYIDIDGLIQALLAA